MHLTGHTGQCETRDHHDVGRLLLQALCWAQRGTGSSSAAAKSLKAR